MEAGGRVRLLAAIDFRAGGNAAAVLREGFSHPEATHCWGLVPRSRLALPALPGGAPCWVLIRISDVFLHPPETPGLRIVAHAGAGRVFDDRVRPGAVIGFPVPAGGPEPLDLVLDYPGAVTPRQAGLAETRDLAARFDGLWLLQGPLDEPALKAAATGHGAPGAAEPIAWDAATRHALAGQTAPGTRRRVAIAGNCIAEALAGRLRAMPEVAARFTVAPVPVHEAAFDAAAARAALEHADIVFVQGIAQQPLAALGFTPRLSCRFIRTPDVVLRSLWPFNAEDAESDALRAARRSSPFRNIDRALEHLRLVEPRPAQRIARYERLDLDLAATIPRTIEAQARFLADIDRGLGTDIGRYIAENCRDRPLFCDSVHPAAPVLQRLGAFMLAELGVAGEPAIPGLDLFEEWRLPVHPVIAARLGLRWADGATRYRYGALGEVTWREWVEAYVAAFG